MTEVNAGEGKRKRKGIAKDKIQGENGKGYRKRR